MKQHIQILNREIEFDLIHKHIKNINLRVKPDGTISLAVPMNTQSSVIEKFMRTNSARILEAIDRLSNTVSKTKKQKQQEFPLLQNGDTIHILGVACCLRICKSDDPHVVRDGNIINVYVSQNRDMQQVHTVLNKWKDDVCRTTVTAICKSVYPVFQTLGVPYPKEIRFRKMSSSLGNCHPNLGIITFSKNIVELPPSCIEFIVQHEFMHFLYPNHSKKFYATLDSVAPHWREAERLLQKYTGTK